MFDSTLENIEHSIVDIGDCFLKLGKVNDQQNSAAYFCEIIDYVGELPTSLYTLNDTNYMVLGYVAASNASTNKKPTEEEFNKKLAETIIDQAINCEKSGPIKLSFKRTEERIGMLRILMSKHPRITFGA